MQRREVLKLLGLSAIPILFPDVLKGINGILKTKINKEEFDNFIWGVATSAYQIEGAWDADGKGLSIWDTFTGKKRKIRDHSNGRIACNFYNLYKQDINILNQIGFSNFRFSISWPRVLPYGIGKKNNKGIDFYNRVIDECLEKNIEPWITLYHWDLPQFLEDKGGWLNRDIIGWFSEYTELCAKVFGDRVKNWLVLNEPLSFCLFGYGIGMHAPGRFGLDKFFKASHHAAIVQAEGGRVLRFHLPDANIGTCFSCSPVDPLDVNSSADVRAALRIDAITNRMFTEPLLGMGYPYDEAPIIHKIDKYIMPDDDKKLTFDFDFWGLQHYFRVMLNGNDLIPILKAKQVSPIKLGETTAMKWEIYPEGIYRILKKFSQYKVKEFLITENGAAFDDKIDGNTINDINRIKYFEGYLSEVLRAKKEGVNVNGYFVWTLIDNFEWAEGYTKRFGLVYNDFLSQKRILKNSAFWWKEFLKNN